MKIHEGILPINKPKDKTSFDIVRAIRKKTGIKKVGHAGTLDPFATGVLILLIGKKFTKQSDTFLHQDKEYRAVFHLGKETTTFDPEGAIIAESAFVPTLSQVEKALLNFQGTIEQIPPMFSAKKVQGQKLYTLARKGIAIERKPQTITLQTTLMDYAYPNLHLKFSCTKGTYIRTIAHDLGKHLSCGSYVKELVRTRCGPYNITDCIDGNALFH